MRDVSPISRVLVCVVSASLLCPLTAPNIVICVVASRNSRQILLPTTIDRQFH